MKVLLVSDRPNWAYDSIARALIAHNDDPALELEVFHLKGRERELRKAAKRFDGVFVLGWQLLSDDEFEDRLPFLDPSRTLTGIHSHHAWDDRKTQPDHDVRPPDKLVALLQRYEGVNTVSRRLTRLFRDAGLDGVVYTPNGVDTRLFRPDSDLPASGRLRVGFSGSRKHDWRKGVSEYIEPAAELAGAEVRLAMPGGDGYVPLDEMPSFYRDLDVYVCASSSEGFSLSVLEAAASGRPIVSTRVGGCEELIEDGVNGFLVDRDVDAIRAKLEYFSSDAEALRRMGEASRRIVEREWSWQHRAPAWLDFIRTRLGDD
jgi:glycosyltransferase involved in cell wall biosynthesis